MARKRKNRTRPTSPYRHANIRTPDNFSSSKAPLPPPAINTRHARRRHGCRTRSDSTYDLRWHTFYRAIVRSVFLGRQSCPLDFCAMISLFSLLFVCTESQTHSTFYDIYRVTCIHICHTYHDIQIVDIQIYTKISWN